MLNQYLFAFLIVHLFLSLIYIILILVNRTSLRREYIIPILVVPVFGFLLAITVELINSFGKPGKRNIELEAIRLENDIYWKTLRRTNENTVIIPLEEAILLNDNKTRRRIMLETLEKGPIKYMDVLMVARENDDVDTVHYATTQISKEQRDLQLKLQQFAVSMEKDPDNINVLNAYIQFFDEYLEKGLLEEALLKRQRILYSQVLDKKLSLIENDRDTLIKKLRNSIILKNFTAADEAALALRKDWPLDEETWIESLRVSVEQKDQGKLRKLIDQMQHTPVRWTQFGKEKIAYWMQ